MPQAAQDHRIDAAMRSRRRWNRPTRYSACRRFHSWLQSVETAKAVNAKARPLYERGAGRARR